MVIKVKSAALDGIDANIIEVEVGIYSGMPSFNIVGLPNATVKEAKERVLSTIHHLGHKLPAKKITINLAPADLRKEGSHYDLPIAIGILAGCEIINADPLEHSMFLGELGLNGSIRPIPGMLPFTLCAKENRIKNLFFPYDNLYEATVIRDIQLQPAKNMHEIIESLNNDIPIHYEYDSNLALADEYMEYHMDMCEVKGQLVVKRGLEIASAGAHNVLMVGPPGSGKSMLAKRIITILPEMTLDESVETTKVYSVSGMMKRNQSLVLKRPFRSPHHTASDVAIIGGGAIPKPGEVSIAHNGVLFLDEFPEFKKNVLQVLREPMEEGQVTISRSESRVTFPSRFMLVAAMNPCPCGNRTNAFAECICSEKQVKKYIHNISGPIMDRIDIHLEVPRIDYGEMSSSVKPESSAQIKTRVQTARNIQLQRFTGTQIYANAQMNRRMIEKFCVIPEDGKRILKMAMEKLGFSARAYDKILKVARTIADLEGRENIQSEDLMESLQYRGLDKLL